jgi:glucose/arabinose dehydrogenase
VRRAAAGLAALLALAGCSGGGSGATTAAKPPTTTAAQPTTAETTTIAEPARRALETVVTGLDKPLYVTSAPGEPNRLYVVEQTGRVRVVEGDRVRVTPFLDLRDRISCCGERGLLSLAFAPDYEESGKLYVNYTNTDGDTRVVEYTATGDRVTVDAGGGSEILAVEQPYSNHNGGLVLFGPDGRLYVGMGDGGSGGDPENRAQDLSDRLGKLLALDVGAQVADWEIVAYGLRNPWRFTFDEGELYLGDVGQSAFEEIDAVPWPPRDLPNFGWDVFEGRSRYEDKAPNPTGTLVAPVAVYSHAEGCSVTGGLVYRGEAIPGLAGRYFYGDYCSGTVWSFRLENGKAREARREPFTVESLTSFGTDAAGELYLVSQGGTIYRLVGA